VLVVKAGVGLAGVALGKWTDAKTITLCDVREEVVRNGVKNCANNGVGNVISFRLAPEEVQKLAMKYDSLVCPDLMAVGFSPQQINELLAVLLKEEGEAVVIMPEKKEQAKRLLEGIDKRLFRIANLILTA
jgi:precorrin-6B methylase 2